MLSVDLANLSAELALYPEDGTVTYACSTIRALGILLRSYADDVAALERQVVPFAARLEPARVPAGVISLDMERQRRPRS